jgi:hypothetical protein
VKPAFFAAKAPWSSWGYESNGSKALVTYQNNWSEHCETDKSSGFLGCVSPYQAAAFCENLDGRLPSINELKDLSSNDNPEWVEQTKDGQDRQFLVRSESGDFVPVGAYQKRSTAGFRCVYEEDSLDK